MALKAGSKNPSDASREAEARAALKILRALLADAGAASKAAPVVVPALEAVVAVASSDATAQNAARIAREFALYRPT